MSISKRLTAFILTVLMVVGAFSFSAAPSSAVTDAEFVAPEITIPETLVVPDNDLLTNNQTYYLAEGSRWEQFVKADFMAEGFKSRGTYNYQKYIVVHNTGAYPATSTALANHNYGKTTTADVSWHFTTGNDGIFQMIPVNERGWHAGGNYWTSSNSSERVTDASNSTGIGIETATPGFPADSAFGGEHWNSAEMYEWYETTFDSTATYLAELVASLCVRLNFNPYTQIVQHYNTAGKNCPMQMRYIFGTNAQYAVKGTYYKVFLNRMYDYYKAFGGSYVSTDTVKNEYYNPSKVVYKKGLYKVNSATTVYRAGNTATGSVGTVSAGSVVDVKIVGYDWGKITLANGTQGWIKLSGLTYVTGNYDCGTYRTASGQIIEITSTDGTTGTYSGGTVSMSTVTRVYKVEVEGDTEFGSAPKYFASGETFTVNAVAPVAPMLFDIWETTSGVARIADKSSARTTVTVLNSDIKLTSSYRDKYFLTVNYGVGSGKYNVGDEVTITASARVGYAFTHWKIVSGNGSFTNPNAATTKFIMGNDDTVITAEYEISKDIDLTGLTNYALKRNYTLAWKGATGSNISWYGSMTDTGLTKLTDGVIATSNFTASQTIYAGFQGTDGFAEVVVDLGQERYLSKVVLRDIADNGGSFGDLNSTTLDIAFSSDNVEFTTAENILDTLYYSYNVSTSGSITQFSNIFTHSIDFVQTSARYVKIRFQAQKYCMCISEVEIYGSEKMTTYDLTVENGTGSGSYASGAQVNITANAPAAGYEFDSWTIVSGSGTIANPKSASTIFTVGSSDATVKANYKQTIKLELTDAASSAGCTMEDGVIKGIGGMTSASDVAAMFKYAVTIKDQNGADVADGELVGTGFTISCGDESVVVLIVGDVNSDALINDADYLAVKQYVKEAAVYSGIYAAACDIDGNGIISTTDIIAMSNQITG